LWQPLDIRSKTPFPAKATPTPIGSSARIHSRKGVGAICRWQCDGIGSPQRPATRFAAFSFDLELSPVLWV
jgi:hypothetical protein